MIKRCIVAILGLLVFSPITMAQKLEIGHLETSDDTGINWLSFHCDRKDASLSCDIFQTRIVYKVEPDQRDAEISNRVSGNVVESFKKLFGPTCDKMDQLLPLINMSIEIRKLRPRQAQEAKRSLEALAVACKDTNPTTIRRFIEISVDQDTRTCRVVQSHSRKTFSLDPGTGNWIAKEGPLGVCGTSSVGTLENPNKQAQAWLYTEKFFNTNPSGVFNGTSCSKFADSTRQYTWKTIDNFVECSRIEPAIK